MNSFLWSYYSEGFKEGYDYFERDIQARVPKILINTKTQRYNVWLCCGLLLSDVPCSTVSWNTVGSLKCFSLFSDSYACIVYTQRKPIKFNFEFIPNVSVTVLVLCLWKYTMHSVGRQGNSIYIALFIHEVDSKCFT